MSLTTVMRVFRWKGSSKIARILALSHFAISFVVTLSIIMYPTESELESLGWLGIFLYCMMWVLAILDFPVYFIPRPWESDAVYAFYIMIFGTIMWFLIGRLIDAFWIKKPRSPEGRRP